MANPAIANFLIIGAGKCGTTSLWSYLNQHPDIGMSKIKEPSFFSQDEVFARGLRWYGTLYDGKQCMAARGEASNSYSATDTYPDTIDRIASVIESPKIIYITRHPMARTESDWMQRRRIEQISFAEFIRTDPIHADKNMYLRCYERYASRFGSESILALFYEDLRADSAAVLSQICAFLGVDQEFCFDTGAQLGQSAEGRRFILGLGRVRDLRLYADMSILLPQSIKSRLRNFFSTTYEVSRPVWTEDDWDWFSARYKEPSQAYLVRVGREPSFWKWGGVADVCQ